MINGIMESTNSASDKLKLLTDLKEQLLNPEKNEDTKLDELSQKYNPNKQQNPIGIELVKLFKKKQQPPKTPKQKQILAEI